MGDLQLQKQTPTDYLSKRPMKNTGYTTYTVKDEHEGIVYCAQCGSPMVRRTYLNRKKENYKGWNCRGRQHKNGCTNPLIRETDLVEELMEAMDRQGIPAEENAEDRITRNI